VVVFCLVGLLPTIVIETIVIFLQWYEIACCSKEFTKQTLNLMDKYMKRYVYEHDILYRIGYILTIYSFWNLKIVKFTRGINSFSKSCFTRVIHSFKTNLYRWQKSGFKIIKVHIMIHYSTSICRSRYSSGEVWR